MASVAIVLAPVWRLMKPEINPGLKEGSPAAGESRAAGA